MKGVKPSLLYNHTNSTDHGAHYQRKENELKNVWQRIKNWLIKKMGGYTEKEFRTVADFKVEPAIIKDSVIMRPHTIRARIHAPMLNPGLSSFRIERELSILLAEELCKNELVSYKRCTDAVGMIMAYEASIEVLKGG